MNKPLLLAAALVLGPLAALADPKPQLRGLLETGTSQKFLLSTEGGTQEKWVGVGDSYGSWKLDAWKADEQKLVLKGPDGAEADLTIEHAGTGAAVEPVKATVEQAQAVLDRMHFSEMMTKIMDQQKVATARMTRQMLARNAKMSPDQIDKALAVQKKVMDSVFSSMNSPEFQQQVAQIYSNVFTPDELRGMAEFYDTPAGQATIQKAPQVQGEMQQIMMPKVMEAMQQAQQQMQQEMKAEKAAKAGGAAAAAAPSGGGS